MSDRELVTILDSLARRRQKRIVTGKVRGGKRSEIITIGKQGKYLKYRVPPDPEKVEDIALLPTIRAAIMHAKNGTVEVKKKDFREKVRRRKISTLLCIVLDSSSSMAEPGKINALRSAMDTIFLDAYQKRDRVALVSAHGHTAEILSKFTSGVDTVKKVADRATFGGTTPLAIGISTGLDLIKSKLSTEPNTLPIMAILTDGRINTPSITGGDVNDELIRLSERAKEMGVRVLVVDVDPEEHGIILSEIFNAEYYHAEHTGEESTFTSPIYEMHAERVVGLLAISGEKRGVLFRNFPEEAIDAAIETVRGAGIEIDSTGCMYHCDPERPEEFCRECQLKSELGILNTVREPMPVEVVEHDISPDELKGRIYLRFLSVPGVFARANRGLLFIKDVDLLSEESASVIADALSSGRNLLEKDGHVVEHSVRFSLAGSIGEGEVPGALKEYFVSVVDAREIEEDELILKSVLGDKVGYKESVRRARAILPEVSVLDTQLDALVRACYDMGFKGNDSEIKIMEYARTISALEKRHTPDMDDMVSAIAFIGGKLAHDPETDEGIERQETDGVKADG